MSDPTRPAAASADPPPAASAVHAARLDVAAFDALPAPEATALLLACAAVPRWAEEIVAARPFAGAAALVTAARTAADPWTDDEVRAAMARHPRLGERPGGTGAEAAASRREQAALGGGPDVAARLVDGNRRYEERFGHVFLLRAAGRGPEEVLAILERRLANPPDVELRAAAANLREIAVLRLAELVGAPSHVTTHVLDAAAGRPAVGLDVVLESLRAAADAPPGTRPGTSPDPVAGASADAWREVAHATTDDDGRTGGLGPAALHPGTYRVRFATGAWFAARGAQTFYPEVTVVFRVGAPDEPGAGHYHVPLLLSPFAYSTYRGS